MPLRVSLCVCVLLSGLPLRTADDVPRATDALGGFALQDARGARLLLLPDVEHPERLETALCSDGRRMAVQFDRRQVERPGANGRQTPQTFDHLAGSVFRIGTGT